MKRGVRISGKDWNPESEPFFAVQKLPVVVSAIRINEPFEVNILEGVQQGNPGDWLIKGVEGELYPCKDRIFRKTYRIMHIREVEE